MIDLTINAMLRILRNSKLLDKPEFVAKKKEMLYNIQKGGVCMDKLRLTGNQLKLIAAVTMTLDHIGAYLFPSVWWLRMVGRLAFPIFAYMVGEGGRYTRCPKRYFLTMAIAAAVCQMVDFVARDSLYQCILVTFSMSIGLIGLLRNAEEKKTPTAWLLVATGLGGAIFVCKVIPKLLPGFGVDYGIIGVLIPVMVYAAGDKVRALLALTMGLACLANGSLYIQWLSLLAVPLLMLYNGQRGKANMKWFFYIYYPAHLVVIYFIGFLL